MPLTIRVVEFVKDYGFAQEGDKGYIQTPNSGEKSPGQLYVFNKQLNRAAWVDREAVKEVNQVSYKQLGLWD